jgi:hypothetical protein
VEKHISSSGLGLQIHPPQQVLEARVVADGSDVRLLRDCGLLSLWGESRLGSVNLAVPLEEHLG